MLIQEQLRRHQSHSTQSSGSKIFATHGSIEIIANAVLSQYRRPSRYLSPTYQIPSITLTNPRISQQDPHQGCRRQLTLRMLRACSSDFFPWHIPRLPLRACPAPTALSPTPPNRALQLHRLRSPCRRKHPSYLLHVGTGRHRHILGRLLWHSDG